MTARLSLRRPTPADIDLIRAIHSDPRACAHNPSDLLSSRAEAEDRYQRWDEHRAGNHPELGSQCGGWPTWPPPVSPPGRR
ncbi:GNAT family N-acetyltransferase [Micromonospora chersina]|uniref:GNAT family N-acetyltransferase n=1 Tax=Micromonospora chersina TaxID=47854 RepID=UPI003710F3F9